ncbi:OmpA family protein [Granulosicoccus sp. 3-233]|uniref:OmpA family protein n=1 Tax=Granulosicoccus sp. 3-233 TaxID=3417969 RepID=UPI003D342852
MISNRNLRPALSASLISIALVACSSAPKQNDRLEQARQAYEQAAEDVTVVKHAPEELDLARDALNVADTRWRKDEDSSSVEHYSYLTTQRVRIAQLIAKSNETDRELEDMALERRSLTLDLREAELLKARQEASELQRQMAALQAEKTERGMVLTLGDVLFDINEATLAPGASRNIGKIASFMREFPDRQAVIEGHTDSMGDDDYNLDLSRSRAFAVRQALIEQGVSASRITTQGFGEALPVASNATAAGRQENRRVEIIFPDAPTQISEFEE